MKQGVKDGVKLEASSRGGSSMRTRMIQATMEHINVNQGYKWGAVLVDLVLGAVSSGRG